MPLDHAAHRMWPIFWAAAHCQQLMHTFQGPGLEPWCPVLLSGVLRLLPPGCEKMCLCLSCASTFLPGGEKNSTWVEGRKEIPPSESCWWGRRWERELQKQSQKLLLGGSHCGLCSLRSTSPQAGHS